MRKLRASESFGIKVGGYTAQRWLNFAAYVPRLDMKSERIIENSFDMQAHHSSEFAAGYLLYNGVKLTTVLRVLTRPWLRRQLIME
jgi:hypothetical protein